MSVLKSTYVAVARNVFASFFTFFFPETPDSLKKTNYLGQSKPEKKKKIVARNCLIKFKNEKKFIWYSQIINEIGEGSGAMKENGGREGRKKWREEVEEKKRKERRR